MLVILVGNRSYPCGPLEYPTLIRRAIGERWLMQENHVILANHPGQFVAGKTPVCSEAKLNLFQITWSL